MYGQGNYTGFPIWKCIFVTFCLGAFPLIAGGGDDADDYFEMSLDELAEEYRTVVSGSRRSQQLSELSVPVTVISAEDIHASGLTSIPELLQFYVGMDVIRLDRNRYAVGVRGLHDEISERTLTLINGRHAANVAYGGSEYYRYPVLIEDIDRIEIVRGPGGAAWGANAFTGVVNIITKAPEDVQGYSAGITLNEFGDTYTHLRAADEWNRWTWRTSLGYESKETSDRAGAGAYTSTVPALNTVIGYPSQYQAKDFSRDWRFDSEAVYKHSETSSLNVGIAYARDIMGDYEVAGVAPSRVNTRLDTLRPYLRWNQVFSDTVEGYIQWYADYADTNIPALADYDWLENDIETQLNIDLHEDHATSLGGNVCWWRIDMQNAANATKVQNFHGEPFDEYQVGVFVIDRWHLTPRWTVEGQGRLDYYSGTDTDWSARMTALYALDEAHKHVLRGSIARAHRTPLVVLRHSSLNFIDPIPPVGEYLFNFTGSPQLKNEKTWTIEGGYTAKLLETLTLLVNAYYQRFEDMIGYNRTMSTHSLNPAIPILAAEALNIDAGDSYGVEVEVEKCFKQTVLSVWYAYNGFDADDSGQFRSYAPAAHKVGCRGRLHIGQGWTLFSQYRYTGTTHSLMGTSKAQQIKNRHRMDISVAKRFLENRAEILVGIRDLFNNDDGPNLGLPEMTGHETPGRTAFARMNYQFK